MNYFLDPITKKFADFSGRASRTEYWMFAISSLVASFVVGIFANMLHFKLLVILFNIVIIIPSISIAIRRLHDTNHSGWWLLIGLVPIIGWFVLFYFYITDSDPADNQYGPNPKAVAPTPTI